MSKKELKKDFFLEKLLDSVALLQQLKKVRQEEVVVIDKFIDSLLEEMKEQEKKEDSKKAQDSTEQQTGNPEESSKSPAQTGEKQPLKKSKSKKAQPSHRSRLEDVLKFIETFEIGDSKPGSAKESEEKIAGVEIFGGSPELENGKASPAPEDSKFGEAPTAGRVYCPVCDEYHDKPH